MRRKAGEVWGTGWRPLVALLGLAFLPAASLGQASGSSGSSVQAMPAQINSNTYQGSIVKQEPVPEVLPLSLDQAIHMGLQYNLGLVLSGTNAGSAGAQQLQQLQALLPTVNASAKEAVQQTNLQAEGLKIPGFPAIIGPYGYTDIRGSVEWSLLNISSLRNYMGRSTTLPEPGFSLYDAERHLVVLTVGNAYLLCIADGSRVQSAQAQVNTSKVSLTRQWPTIKRERRRCWTSCAPGWTTRPNNRP